MRLYRIRRMELRGDAGERDDDGPPARVPASMNDER